MMKLKNLTKIQHEILNLMWKKKKSSRNEIGRVLNVNPSTISRNIDDLIKANLLKVIGELPASSRGGRKTKILSFNDGFKKVIGISVEQGEVTTVLSTLRGKVLKKDYKVVDMNSNNFISIVKENYDKYANQDVVGLSIATPGIVSSSDGTIIFSSALGMKNVKVASSIESAFGVKTMIMNNANAAAASHYMRTNDLIYFIFSIPYILERPVGIGAGIMIGGKIHEGFNMRAGEFWRSLSLTDEKGLTVRDLKNEKTFEKLRLNEFVEYFSNLIEIAVDILDPEMYVVGGDVSLLPKWVGNLLVEKAEERIKVQNERKLKAIIDENGTFSIAKGAALAFASKMMSDFDFAKEVFSLCELEVRE